MTGLHGGQALREDPWLRLLTLWLPPLGTLFFLAVFAQGVPRDLPLAVVNQDPGNASRELVRALDASPGLAVYREYRSRAPARRALRRGEVLATVVIPEDFAAHLRQGRSPRLAAFENTQYLLAGKFIGSALVDAVGDYSARAGAALRLAHGDPAPRVALAVKAVRPQVVSLFNPVMSYARFLVTAIVPALWQVLLVVATVLVVFWRLRRAPLPARPGPRLAALASALAPVGLAFWLQGLLMLALFGLLLDWQPAGGLLWLWLGLALTVLAVQAMAVLIVALLPEPLHALSVCAAYLAPAFAFMGITFPRADMNTLAWWWGALMPSTHYMNLQVAVADHAAPFATLWPSLAALLLFLVPLPLSVRALPGGGDR